MTPHPRNADRRLFFIVSAVVLLIVIAAAVLSPAAAVDDPRPSTYNTAPGGAKAAFLTLEALHTPVVRWEQPLSDLPLAEAPHTTLILAEPQYSALDKDGLYAAIGTFLQHGGRLLTTGASGALLIPGGATRSSRRFGTLCYTQPEGPGRLAQAGKVEMADSAAWVSDASSQSGSKPDASVSTPAPSSIPSVEQRCGPDAVVVRVPVGAGEAVWWSSASPLTNAELSHDADLRLLLASLGTNRRILFDETLQQPLRSKWSATTGLPLWPLLAQAALVFGLLVFSFSRRRGPVRLPVTVPRSSPVEFATSMGDLYARAGAMGVAVAAAKRRLQRVLLRDGGLSQQAAEGDPTEVARVLAARFGGDWSHLADHLRQALASADTPLRSRSTLALIRALGEDAERVQSVAGTRAASPAAWETPAPAAAPQP